MRRIPSRSLIETPSMNSIAITRGVESSSKTKRNVRGRSPANWSPATLHRAPLGREVELALDRALEFAGQRQRPVRGQVRQPSFDQLAEVLDDVEVGLDDLGDVGPLHFEGGDPSVVQTSHGAPARSTRRPPAFSSIDAKISAERPPIFLARIVSTCPNGKLRTSSRKAGQLVRV